MSDLRNILDDIVEDRQSFTGDVIINLRTGRQFTGEVEEIQDAELNTELGRDAREQIIIHVLDRDAADEVQMNDRFKIEDITFVVLRRKDNPRSPQVDFGCMKIVPGKDS